MEQPTDRFIDSLDLGPDQDSPQPHRRVPIVHVDELIFVGLTDALEESGLLDEYLDVGNLDCGDVIFTTTRTQ